MHDETTVSSDLAATEASNQVLDYRTKSQRNADTMRKMAGAYLAAGREDLHNTVMLGIDVEHLPSHVVRRLRDRIPVGSSFAAAMAATNAFVRSAKTTRAKDYLRITNKEHGRKLAAELGLKVAQRYQNAVRLEDLSPIPNCVVKPVYSSGSRGVLIYSQKGELILVRSGRILSSFDEYKRLMSGWLATGELRHDLWVVEEYLTGPGGEPARDIKFYTFYGNVGLTLECKRHPETRYCFYEGTVPVNTGKYEDKSFIGNGPEASWLSEMGELSARLPLPFLRIDTYHTTGGLYFGEFTTVPGKYQSFNVAYDRKLGELWNEARAKIFADLLAGKRFPEFLKFAGLS